MLTMKADMHWQYRITTKPTSYGSNRATLISLSLTYKCFSSLLLEECIFLLARMIMHSIVSITVEAMVKN